MQKETKIKINEPPIDASFFLDKNRGGALSPPLLGSGDAPVMLCQCVCVCVGGGGHVKWGKS